MLFEFIFVGLFVVAWLICGFVPWLALSVFTHGRAGLVNLPLSLFAALVAGLAVPVFGLTGESGIWLSVAAAVAVPSFLLGLRRLSVHGSTTPHVQQER
ncbi:MAG: hypothetical protein ABI782_06930 [Anaerolineaceae bacterium]